MSNEPSKENFQFKLPLQQRWLRPNLYALSYMFDRRWDYWSSTGRNQRNTPSGQDISLDMCKMATINALIYIPWMAFPARSRIDWNTKEELFESFGDVQEMEKYNSLQEASAGL